MVFAAVSPDKVLPPPPPPGTMTKMMDKVETYLRTPFLFFEHGRCVDRWYVGRLAIVCVYLIEPCRRRLISDLIQELCDPLLPQPAL